MKNNPQWDVDVLEAALKDAQGVVSILDIGIDRVSSALGIERRKGFDDGKRTASLTTDEWGEVLGALDLSIRNEKANAVIWKGFDRVAQHEASVKKSEAVRRAIKAQIGEQE